MNKTEIHMNGNAARQYQPSKTVDSMVEAFREHCHDGGADFTEYLKDWHKSDALAEINDAAQNYTAEAAIGIIKKALGELFEIAAQGHRDEVEMGEGVEPAP